MPKIPDDMSEAAIARRAKLTEEMRAKHKEPSPEAPPKIRIAKKR
jgi:hypothetical protein